MFLYFTLYFLREFFWGWVYLSLWMCTYIPSKKNKIKIRYVFISYFILFLIEQNVSNEPMHAIQIYAPFGWAKYWIYISSLNSFKSLFETLFLEQGSSHSLKNFKANVFNEITDVHPKKKKRSNWLLLLLLYLDVRILIIDGWKLQNTFQHV